MLWIDAVLAYDEQAIACAMRVRDTPAYCSEGRAEAVFAVEWMAQTVAAFIGLRDRVGGEVPRPGFLIGAPRVRFEVDGFAVGAELRVEARHTFGDAHLASFDCRVLSGQDLAVDATLNFFRPKRGEAWP